MGYQSKSEHKKRGDIMETVSLTPADIATLLLLNTAVLDVIEGNISNDTLEELKSLQPKLECILYKEESPMYPSLPQHDTQSLNHSQGA